MTKLQDFLYNLMPQLKKERNEVFEREKQKFIKKRLKEIDTGSFKSKQYQDLNVIMHDVHEEGKTKAQIQEERKNRAGR